MPRWSKWREGSIMQIEAKKKGLRVGTLAPYIMVFPAIAFLCVFTIYPIST